MSERRHPEVAGPGTAATIPSLAPYKDPTLPVDDRINDLVSRMTIQEKAGLMFHTMVPAGPSGTLAGSQQRFGRASTSELVSGKLINHVNVMRLPSAREGARWHNRIQELALETRLGIPVTVSTDPRHAFSENPAASFAAGFFSAWPEAMGLAAIRDPETVYEFADAARQEYLAVGIRAALHPSVDLATEARWARQYSTFGQDSKLTCELVAAYLNGFQGAEVGIGSVACMTKHFPGGGPQLDGEDPHFPYGREQIYPGNNLEYHLAPFRAAIEANTSSIMPYYGMPLGLELDGIPVERVGFGFNKQIITGLLREKLGFQGVVCTDWGLITGNSMGGKHLPARAWGVENLSGAERMVKILEAGCDQFGGEEDPQTLVSLIEQGAVEVERIDQSVRRLLRVKFELGLFENRFVDEDNAEVVAGRREFVAAGRRVQSRSVVLLKKSPVLPLRAGAKVHSEGLDIKELESRGLVPVALKDADVILSRVGSPYEPRDEWFLESGFQAGSLEYSPEFIRQIQEFSEKCPTILVVNMIRPAILEPFVDCCAGLAATFGVSDGALLDVLTGVVPPEGRLPFELPASMADVEASDADVPGTGGGLFPFGYGLELN